jgi:uncharacterized protein (TIGR03437 family)
MRSLTIPTLCLFALAALPWAASAQNFDSSGDGLLNGPYFVRQVLYLTDPSATPQGAIGQRITTYGQITFDGNGSYTFSGSFVDSTASSSTPQAFTSSGTYVIGANGMGYMTEFNNQESLDAQDFIVGMISHGIFIGSTTQNSEAFNDMVVAVPVSGSGPTNATLSGSYAVAYMDPSFPGDAFFSFNADGNGNIGNVDVSSLIGTSDPATTTLSGVTYSFANGIGQIKFGGNTTTDLVAGNSVLYVSPDGNVIVGGLPNAFDMFVGVRPATSNPASYDALYYQAGLDLDEKPAASQNFVLFDSYYGAINAFGGKTIIGHQSLNSQQIYSGTADFTYYDEYTLNGDGTSDDFDFGQSYVSSKDGNIRIGYGNVAGLLSLNVAVKAPTPTGSGVFLNPVGIVNAASSAPFTAHLSPGEFLTLLGSGLAQSAVSASTLPLPTTLNHVQVMVNGIAAPIQFVSPGQINIIVPFLTDSIAEIKVINNNVSSNTVSEFVGATSAGVFTVPAGGIAEAAALHPSDFSLVTSDNPAGDGETIAVYLAGLGTTTPRVAAGAAGPSSPLANTDSQTEVFLLDQGNSFVQANPNAALPFSGLAPGFAGLYQINFTVPTGLKAGESSLEVLGTDANGAIDSDTFESLLPLAGGASSALTPSARRGAMSNHQMVLHHRLSNGSALRAPRGIGNSPRQTVNSRDIR